MSRIRIKNFGPIKEGYQENDGWIDVKKVTVFIGNQASGKSTVAKLISTMMWLEKAVYRGDVSAEIMTWKDFVDENCAYHRIHNYAKPETEIDYIGEIYKISYRHGSIEFTAQHTEGGYYVPKIMYVPAERNFLSTVEGADDVKGLPKPLYTFSEELIRSKKELNGRIELPISKLFFEYRNQTETSVIIGKDYILDLLEASSGLQSVVPLFLVSRNLMLSIERKPDNSKVNISVKQGLRQDKEIETVENDKSLSQEEKNKRKKLIRGKYQNNCFINIVEEPEQNLFPTSQKEILESLLELNNSNIGNKLIMTTHSPYLINYLTLAVKAKAVLNKWGLVKMENPDLNALNNIVKIYAAINSGDLVIYEVDEKIGTILKLKDYKGLPSDDNYLNMDLEHSNELFAELQEMEKGWR
jgi:energy-coupling factor transporter ATP-binding protein EcfA2